MSSPGNPDRRKGVITLFLREPAIRLATFLLLPLYVVYLSPSDLGILGLLAMVAALGSPVAHMGAHFAIPRRFVASPAARDTIVGSGLINSLVASLLIGGGVLLAARPLSGWILGSTDLVLLMQLNGGIIFLRAMAVVPGETMKSREDFTALSIFSSAAPILKLLVAVPLVAVAHLGVQGILLADIVAWGLVDTLALLWLLRRHRPTPSRKEGLDLLRVGSPVILHALSRQGLHMADRGILLIYRSLADVGVYHIAYAFGLLIEQAILLPLRQAWEPWILKMDPEKREAATQPVLYGSLGICLIGSLGMGLLLDDLLALIAPGKFPGAEAMVFPIALGYSLMAVFYQVDYRVLEAGKTWIYTAATGPAFLINVGLNFLLIPRMGGIGAACSTFVSMMVMTGLLFVVGRGYVSIRSGPLFRMTGLLLIAVTAWIIPLRVPQDYLPPVLVEAFVLLATSVLILTLAPPSRAVRIFLRRES